MDTLRPSHADFTKSRLYFRSRLGHYLSVILHSRRNKLVHATLISTVNMPYFEENPLSKLDISADSADEVLDLRGLEQNRALVLVEQLLNKPDNGRSYLILFDKATGDGKETLFLPLGRQLLTAKQAGLVKSFLPTKDSSSFFIRFDD